MKKYNVEWKDRDGYCYRGVVEEYEEGDLEFEVKNPVLAQISVEKEGSLVFGGVNNGGK